VQPAEIDALLETNPPVAEACVFGIVDPLGGEAVAAAIRVRDGARVSAESLQAWCRERVRREAVPEHWFFVSDIPRNARCKVSREADRRALFKKPITDVSNPSLARAVPDPDSALTQTVRAAVKHAWTEVLRHKSYIGEVPLPDAAVDSLDMLRMWPLIEKTLSKRLSMDVLESDPKPSELTASLVQQLRAAPRRSPASVKPHNTNSLSYASGVGQLAGTSSLLRSIQRQDSLRFDRVSGLVHDGRPPPRRL
jgi:hypothetical protein